MDGRRNGRGRPRGRGSYNKNERRPQSQKTFWNKNSTHNHNVKPVKEDMRRKGGQMLDADHKEKKGLIWDNNSEHSKSSDMDKTHVQSTDNTWIVEGMEDRTKTQETDKSKFDDKNWPPKQDGTSQPPNRPHKGRNVNTKPTAMMRARKEFDHQKQRKAEFIQRQQEERDVKKAKHAESVAKRKDNFKVYQRKTKKGQPIMSARMDLLLEKIQKSIND